MKKRKELDALVANGKLGAAKRSAAVKKSGGSCSAHELLRHDTESSDMEDFSIMQPRRKERKKHRNRLCITSVCLPLCQFILVTTSFLVSGALIWLHIGLREDIDLLRAHIQKVEAGNRNTPEALHVIHSKLKQIDSNVTMLYLEVRKNIVDIENITNEVKLLKDVSQNIKESIAAAPAIEQLPKDVHSLSERVATFGSKLNAFESNLKELKDQQSNLQITAQNLSGELDSVKVTLLDVTNSTDVQSKSSPNTTLKDMKLQNAVQETNQLVHYLQQELMNTVRAVDKVNSSFTRQLSMCSELPTKVDTLNDAIISIINDSHIHNSRMVALENFVYLNITLRLEQMESEKEHPLSKTDASDVEAYVNKTLSAAILKVLSSGNLHDTNVSNREDPLHSLEQTHDVLVLLASLLRQFNQFPESSILSETNATKTVTAMLHSAFGQLISSRDMEIEAMENKIKIFARCLPCSEGTKAVTTEENVTTPDHSLSVQASEKVPEE